MNKQHPLQQQKKKQKNLLQKQKKQKQNPKNKKRELKALFFLYKHLVKNLNLLYILYIFCHLITH